MQSPIKSIINYIPDFLEYCRTEKHFLPKTIETYTRFLNRFILWLKESRLTGILPYQLSIEHIQEYKNYLSKQISPGTNQHLTKKTQNYYLIALRALLSYFIEKDIPSLLPDKIKLLKEDQFLYKNKFLNLEQIEKLLQAPKTSTITGLRDKALLETLFSTGLKVAQLTALNRDQVKIEENTKNLEIRILDKENSYLRSMYLSERAINSLREYLQTRKDKEKALFINYKGPKNASRRLTTRSVENIVKKYTEKAKLPIFLTPEILRNVYVLNLLQQEEAIQITQKPLAHKVLIIEAYEFPFNKNLYLNKNRSGSYSWHLVENIINKEIEWLKNNILILPESYKPRYPIINCDHCLFRKIAILIVSGKIKAIEFKTKKGQDLWNGLISQKIFQNRSKHGQEWHRKMMDVISEYFRLQNHKVVLEPILNYGRADLGIYSNHNKVIYIEVGTVSLFKLWYNLSTMKNITFLIVPNEEYLIEFKT